MNAPHHPQHEVFEGTELGPWQPVGDIDIESLDLTTQLFGAASLALFFSLLLPWYTRSGSPAGSASAMVAGGWRWLIWLLSLASTVFVFLEAVSSLRLPSVFTNPRQRSQLFVGVAAVNVILVFLAAFAAKAQPPSLVTVPAGTGVGTGVGAYVGLLASLGALAAAVVGLRNLGRDAAPATAAGGPASGLTDSQVGGTRAPGRGEPPLGGASRSVATAPSTAGPARIPMQQPAAPGSDPPTGWMPPQPPPPPPL